MIGDDYDFRAKCERLERERDEARAKLARAMQPDRVYVALLQERTRCDEWRVQAKDWEAKAAALETERDEARANLAIAEAETRDIAAKRDEAQNDYARRHKDAAYWSVKAVTARAQAFAECEAIVLRVKADYVDRPEAFTLQNIADEIAKAAGAKP